MYLHHLWTGRRGASSPGYGCWSSPGDWRSSQTGRSWTRPEVEGCRQSRTSGEYKSKRSKVITCWWLSYPHSVLSLPGHPCRLFLFNAAICWGWGVTVSSHVPTVLFVLTVAAVRREAQVGWRCQIFCAAVNLRMMSTGEWCQIQSKNCVAGGNKSTNTCWRKDQFFHYSNLDQNRNFIGTKCSWESSLKTCDVFTVAISIWAQLYFT